MPSIVTHHLFAKDCLKGYEKKVNKNIYYIFAQSFDNLAYYHFFRGFNNNIRELGKTAQSTKSNEYFINLLNYIKDNNLENDKDVIGYLFGSICHYALDSTCHPFVVFESGSVNIDQKYRGGHEKMEVMIDAIMYEEKEHKPLYKENLSNVLLPKVKFSNNLRKALDYTFNETFNEDNMGIKYEKAYKTGNFILKFFVTDKIGIKKKIYKLKDHFGKGRMYQYLSFNIKKLDKSFLNLEHNEWCYPNDNNIIKNSSFYELYNDALLFARRLFKVSLNYLDNKFDENKVNSEFKDLSYVTGLDWHLKKKTKYFRR